MQTIARGEEVGIRGRVVLLSGPDDRQFFVRFGKKGQVRRFEVELLPEVDGDGDVYLVGDVSASQTAALSAGPTDVSVHATNPIAFLFRGRVMVEDAVGGTVAGVL